jgi:hypothetical protein
VGQCVRWSIFVALAVAAADVRAFADPSRWSDSERTGDLVYFGAYGGVSFARASGGVNQKSVDFGQDFGTYSVSALGGPPSPAGGYEVAFWPNDFVGLDGTWEVFGLSLSRPGGRFESCTTCTFHQKLPSYEGLGSQIGPTLHAGVPLKFIQPTIGVGLQMPITWQFTQDPATRLDTTAFEVGGSLRASGGFNILISRTFKLFAEYHFEYRFATINPEEPIENKGLMRHVIVLGFLHSPESYRSMPGSDKAAQILAPFGIPLAVSVLGAVLRGAMHYK